MDIFNAWAKLHFTGCIMMAFAYCFVFFSCHFKQYFKE